MDTRRGRRLRAAAALVVAAFATLVAAPAAVAAPVPAAVPAALPAVLPGEELNELVEPSIVHLTIAWNGYVRFPSDEGWVWSDPIDVAYGCSGFFVTETGHVMTAGHCVEPDSGKEEVIKAFLQSQVDLGVLTPEDAGALLPGALLDWPVEGRGAGAPMDRVIQAVQPRAVEGAVLDQPLNAQLIDFRSFDEGDLALLKVETTGAVPIPVADADPRSGSPLTAVGFPGAVGQVVDVNLVRASFKTGTVSSTQVSASGVAQTEVNADMSGGMSGGPTVDGVGNVLGVNSFRINGETQAFNFITDTTDLSEWLGAKNLQLPQLRTAPVATPAGTRPPRPRSRASPGSRCGSGSSSPPASSRWRPP
ncbi:hypothetical protein BJF78_01570 [Pseudonocardia sp. CNS-139]|nr:hypothetical protein BJF78_01570 [Pseudonocardia sp. CNS-139]